MGTIMSSSVTRPGSVTFVVFLMWLFAIGSIAGGVLLLFANDNVTVNGNSATVYAWISIAIGLFIALLATSLSGGSRFVRFLVILTMSARIALDVYAWIVINNPPVFQLGTSIAFAALIIALLTTRRASEFFRG